MKKRSGKNLIRFFYHLLVVLVMAMPMLSGLVRVIYVQANQNAYESYYGVNEPQYNFVNTEYLYSGSFYTFDINGSTTISNFAKINGQLTRFYCSESYINTAINNAIDTITGIGYVSNTTLVFYVGDNTDFSYYCGNNLTTRVIQFDFTPSINAVFYPNNFIFYAQYIDYYYLDNVFDYSIWKTMQDFTFHTDFRFTDIANGMLMTFDNNNLYIQYINFYINWVLTTAVISFAPYVLLTFYHLAIGILDKFMKKGEDL